MHSKQKNKKSHHGIIIFILSVIGMAAEPGYPHQVTLQDTYVISSVMLAILILFIWMVRKVTNKERIFKSGMQLSKIQLIMIFIFMAYFAFIYITNGNIPSLIELYQQPLKIIISCTFVALGAGFFEEYFVRGYLFNLTQRLLSHYNVQKNRLLIISVITSFAFGLLHLTNLDGTNTLATLQQVFYAGCLGMMFCVIRIITNRIWVAAIFHFLFDYSLFIINDMEASSWSEIITVFLIAFVLSVAILVSLDKTTQKTVEVLKP